MHLNLKKAIRILSTLLALSVVVACAPRPAQAQTFTTLYSFQGPTLHDGSYPNGLVQAANGYLYGTTGAGGISGAGTVFRISTTGAETPLYTFDTGGGDPDGEGNSAALVQAANGTLYGTTQGNSGGCGGPNGTCGVFYKITPAGALTILYDFCAVGGGSCLDGTTTEAALVQASNGDFYGTNQASGAYDAGTIFKLTPSGVLTTLHSFCSLQQYEDCPDGAPAYSPLVQGTDGNLYGTTGYGGANFFDGTAFKITPGGTFTTLHSFGTNGDLGEYPTGGLVQAANGNFYGTTEAGGATGYGSFYTMTPSGTVTTLYSFCPTGNCTDGNAPTGRLLLATDGNFYGLTTGGGANNVGTIFQLTPSGALTTLHNFDLTDGYGGGTIIQDTSGTLYGTTLEGGINYQTCACGTVFSLQMGLRPFVETLPVSGRVGASVTILGTNLTGATSVTFNGTAATFTVKSKSEITTTVPVGATTGTVKVVTAHSGTLSSNVVFTVN
jgi:uncharacterized repeat protein (TIGR03803 family)